MATWPVARVLRFGIGTAIALLVLLIAVMLSLPLWPDFEPRDYSLYGIRSVWLLPVADKNAEQCGISEDEIAGAVKAVLRESSLRIAEVGPEADGALIYVVRGVATADHCFLSMDWSVRANVLTKKDRREVMATVASDGHLVDFSRREAARGKLLALAHVHLHTKKLVARWSEANPRK